MAQSNILFFILGVFLITSPVQSLAQDRVEGFVPVAHDFNKHAEYRDHSRHRIKKRMRKLKHRMRELQWELSQLEHELDRRQHKRGHHQYNRQKHQGSGRGRHGSRGAVVYGKVWIDL